MVCSFERQKSILQLLILFKKFWMKLGANQIQYGGDKSSEFYNK